MTTKIETPVEIVRPYSGCVDGGLILVHDIAGYRRNYLHEVEVPATETQSIRMLHADGYHQHSGFWKDGQQWWVYCKRYPLTVETWNA